MIRTRGDEDVGVLAVTHGVPRPWIRPAMASSARLQRAILRIPGCSCRRNASRCSCQHSSTRELHEIFSLNERMSERMPARQTAKEVPSGTTLTRLCDEDVLGVMREKTHV